MDPLTQLMGDAQNEIVRLDNKRREMNTLKGARNTILSLMFLSYYEAQNCLRSGYISGEQWRLYKVWWHWGNYRISSIVQELYCEKHGFAAMTNRINNFRNKLGLKPISWLDSI